MHILQIVKTTLQQCTRLVAHRAPPLHEQPPPPGHPADSLKPWLMDVDLGAPSVAPRPFNDHQSYPLPSKEPYSTIPKSILASLLTLPLIRRALVRPDVRSWARRGDAPASGVKCTTSPNGTSSYIRPASSTAGASASGESVRSALQSARYKSKRKKYMRRETVFPLQLNARVCTNAQTHAHTHAHTHKHTQTHMHTHTHTHKHKQTQTHTHIHTRVIHGDAQWISVRA